MIGLVTDSNAQLPAPLAAERSIAVVSLVIELDGVSYHEGINLDVEAFYAQVAAGATVSTSQPSPGEVAAVYQHLIDAGATEIVSVHIGSELSGTLNSARLAGAMVDVPVHLVDTRQTSFSIAWGVLAAADARDAGADAGAMQAAAIDACSRAKNVFVLGGVDLARASGRVEVTPEHTAAVGDGIAVMSFVDGNLDVLGSVAELGAAVELMVGAITSSAGASASGLRVAIGAADRDTFGFYEEFERQLAGRREIESVRRYRCGPSVGAYTGPGTAGACWY